MDMIMQVIIQYVAEIVALIVISAIGIIGAYILNKINKNQNLKNIGEATEQVIAAAQETVLRLQQTMVEGMKELAEDGKLTPEQIAELKEQTLQITLETLGAPILDLLLAAKVDVAGLITNAAEAYICEMKMAPATE